MLTLICHKMNLITATLLNEWVHYEMTNCGVLVFEVYIKGDNMKLGDMILKHYERSGFMGYGDDQVS